MYSDFVLLAATYRRIQCKQEKMSFQHMCPNDQLES
jgi:hypothetical protein